MSNDSTNDSVSQDDAVRPFHQYVLNHAVDVDLAQKALELVAPLFAADALCAEGDGTAFPLADAAAVDVSDLAHLLACATGYKKDLMTIRTISVREVQEGGPARALVDELLALSASEDAFFNGYAEKAYREQVAGVLGKKFANDLLEHFLPAIPNDGFRQSLYRAMGNPGLRNFLRCANDDVNTLFLCAVASAIYGETAKPLQYATQGYEIFSRLARHVLNGVVPLGWTAEKKSWRPRTTWYVLVA